MMVIEYENLKLQLITINDIEQLRLWRNAQHVVEMMEFQDSISEEQQMAWYSSLDFQKNLYFKIIISEQPIGVVNLKNIDWDKGTAEAGVFLGEYSHLNTITPLLSVLLMMRLAYDVFQFDFLNAKIALHNQNALNFNKQLGYIQQDFSHPKFGNFRCSKEDFYKNDSTLGKVNQLFDKHGSIHLYLDRNSEWVLKHMNTDQEIFQFHLL